MTPEARPSIFLSAGEPSGDLHGAGLAEALRERLPGVALEGFGGPRMAAAGVTIHCSIERLSGIGFGLVVTSVPRHWRLFSAARAAARQGRYPLAILIDYPGFHLRLAGAFRSAGTKVLYYIAPQVWAWRPGRIDRISRVVDRLATILPFEPAYFAARGVPSVFVGHPSLDRAWPSRAEARATLGLPGTEPVVGIFPGSRAGEIERNWPLFREVGRRMLLEGRCFAAVVAGTPSGYYPEPEGFRIHRGDSTVVTAAATAVLAKSGTTTLEAAIAGTPMVVAYRTGWLTYHVATRLMTVPSISLVNLVA